jgi:hypothetical protein
MEARRTKRARDPVEEALAVDEWRKAWAGCGRGRSSWWSRPADRERNNAVVLEKELERPLRRR